MSIQHVFLEKGGVFYFCKIKCSHIVPHLPYYVIKKFLHRPPEEMGIPLGEEQMKEKKWMAERQRITSPRR